MSIFTRKIDAKPFLTSFNFLISLLAIFISSILLLSWFKSIIRGETKFDTSLSIFGFLDWGYLIGLLSILIFGVLKFYKEIKRIKQKSNFQNQNNNLDKVTKNFGTLGIGVLFVVIAIAILLVKWMLML